eukprot:752723-Hanusia_phi.AAC.5
MRVIVVGGGVAGLTIARALALRGIDCKVYDRAIGPASRQDRGLGLWDVSEKRLRELGLGDFLSQNALYTRPAAYRDVQGTWLSSCRSSERNERRVACLHQSHLLEALAREGLQVDIEWNKELKHVEQDSSKVKAYFQDGTEEEGSILVGADGLFSTVRRLIFPDSEMIFTGKTCYSTIVECSLKSFAFETLGRLEIKRMPDGHGKKLESLQGAPLRIAMVPLKGERMFWFATLQANKELSNELSSKLPEFFSFWHEPVPSILRSSIKTGDARVLEDRHEGSQARGCVTGLLREAVYELEAPLPRWSSGRVALLGDACHPLSPNLAQGAALSIESAFKLAEAIAQSKDDHGSAFDMHQRSMQRRVTACTRVTEFTKVLAMFPEASGLMSYVDLSLACRPFLTGFGRSQARSTDSSSMLF